MARTQRPTEDTPGDRLGRAIKQAGLTNAEVAKAAEVNEKTVSKWRSNTQWPRTDAELHKVVRLLNSRGVEVTVPWLRYGAPGSDGEARRSAGEADGNTRQVREPMVFYQGALPREIRFASPSSAQQGRTWLEQFLTEIVGEGAGADFVDSARRLLLNPANYEHGFGAAAGHHDEMDDEQKLRHMQGLAVGIRAILKERARTKATQRTK